jgi:hypothetical protein
MINIKNQLPGIYYDASRDFQLLGHLYELVLNYVKTNADMLYLLPNGLEADTRTTELLATTLGFKLRRNYDKEQLAALVSIFPRLLKVKGTKQAIDLAGNALVKASGVSGEFSSIIENHVLTIKIPLELSDMTLFIDLLPYILPFGLSVVIERASVITERVSLAVGTDSIVRVALPSTENAHEKYISHPLGLVNISYNDNNTSDNLSDDKLAVEYSTRASVVDNLNEDGSVVKYSSRPFIDSYGNATPGLFGTSPIIDFYNEKEDQSFSRTNTVDMEENT